VTGSVISASGPSATVARVGAVVALKPTESAKSRLGTLPDPLRRRLAWTMALDTLAALSDAVDEVAVVSGQPALESRLRRAGLVVTVVAEPLATGMNAALSHGSAWLAQERGCTTVLASVGDLPALRHESVRRVLAASAGQPRSFLADASGVGTTMLIARATGLAPRFQGASAAAHAHSGAVALTDDALGGALPDARTDVDTETDLALALPLGLGPSTSRLIDPASGMLGRYDVLTVTEHQGAGSDQVVITSRGTRRALTAGAVTDGLRELHPGQRLHAVFAPDRVLSAWL
jgi:2-phospho-L-lactate guanylyltransferase